VIITDQLLGFWPAVSPAASLCVTAILFARLAFVPREVLTTDRPARQVERRVRVLVGRDDNLKRLVRDVESVVPHSRTVPHPRLASDVGDQGRRIRHATAVRGPKQVQDETTT